MAVKRCPWCKTENPAIYDHCMKCGGPLPTAAKSGSAKDYLIPAIILIVVVVAIIYLVIPALHLSAATGKNLSLAINSGPAQAASVPRYGIGEPAQYGDLRITLNQEKFGSETVNNGHFLTVTASIQNLNKDSTYSIGAGDFVLTDSGGNYYSSTGIGSRVSYDAGPGSTGIADLVYLVPKDADKLQVLYTFPDESGSGTVSGRQEVAFVL